MKDDHIYKRHNKSLLLYHIVCPVKYRREVITKEVKKTIEETSKEISERYEINFIESGVDEDHVHFLIQIVQILSLQRIVQTIKSIMSKEIFKKNPEVKRMLWGGKFWTNGYYINTVGKYASKDVIERYVKNQGKVYQRVYTGQPTLFDQQ